ncbi:hypothetical protein AN639_03515 [Candidatus Epulonipiscium fishelsonii]|uniref:Uncharacterized protein n=1 Tax=Candidatus Epulonipiscium fishelsonii TaxID=77094 RepID=A0ACC8XF77_9FIRM|nr:hypothetical protein AN639_03515 [Epulopiscium sp. SCG-B05WGA-EpuloA1]ONI41928.1 hypothetical protein AN396_02710 [Epulopiscium sp. SCG-B11WGA-EpuloA1]
MKPIMPNMFEQYKYLSDLKANANNTLIGFIVSEVDTKKNGYNKSLYLYDDKEIVKFNADINNFIFDGQYILSRKVGQFNTTFTRYDLNANVKKEFTLPLKVIKVYKLKESTYLLVSKVDITNPNYYKQSEQEQKEYEAKVEANKSFHILDEYPYYFNGEGYVNKTRNSLYIYNEETNTINKITPDNMNVEHIDICKNEILFSGKEYTTNKEFTSQVYLYDFSDSSLKTLYSKNDIRVLRIFYKDGVPHFGGTNGMRHGYTEHPIFYMLKGNDEIVAVADPDLGFFNTAGTDSRFGAYNNYLNYKGKPYFIATHKDSACVFSFEDGKTEFVIDIAGSTDAIAFLNGKMITIGFYDMRLQEIYSVKDNVANRISSFNEWVKQEYYVAEPIPHSIKQVDYTVDGYVLEPINYDPNKKYPAILDIHGGPKTAYGPLYYHEMQMWASMGYFVIFCNPKGSDGKGNFFTNIRDGVYGSVPFDDLMKFTDLALNNYQAIDSSRVAVAGGSYGGYMTNYIITQTNRFACAISQRSISNWVSMVASGDCGIDFPIKMKVKDIRNCHEELWEVSPLKYVNNAETPTLFIHALRDYRCPITEALQMYTAMKLRGVETRMCVFEGENHDLTRNGRPKSRRKNFEEINKWLLKYTS